MCRRQDSLNPQVIDSIPFCQGSSVVEQRTHKPLVASSILAPGTIFYKPQRTHDGGRPFFRLTLCSLVQG